MAGPGLVCQQQTKLKCMQPNNLDATGNKTIVTSIA